MKSRGTPLFEVSVLALKMHGCVRPALALLNPAHLTVL